MLNLGGIPAAGGAGLMYHKTSLGGIRHTCTGGQWLSRRTRRVLLLTGLWRKLLGHGLART